MYVDYMSAAKDLRASNQKRRPVLVVDYGLVLWPELPKKVIGTAPSTAPGTEGPDAVGNTPYLPYVF